MDWTAALLAAAGLVAVATAAGLALRARSGRVARVEAAPAQAEHRGSDASALGLSPDVMGGDATLVQFSTEFCSRCPGTARQLQAIAAEQGAVRHVEIDLTHDPALAKRFAVLQTPTTLVLDAGGRTVARIGGVPRGDELRALLHSLIRRTRVAN